MICKRNLVKFILTNKKTLRYITVKASKDFRETDVFKYFTNNLKIPEDKATHILIKTPSIENTSKDQLFNVIKMFDKHNINPSDLLRFPKLLNFPANRIDYRVKILRECGFQNVSCREISFYFKLMSSKTIADLKDEGYLPKDKNVQDSIIKYLTMWPTSPPMINLGDDSKLNLVDVRMNVLERYLELVLDLQPEIFREGLKTYVKLRHRPFSHINLTLQYLQDIVKMPNKKINSNLLVLLANPDNLYMILTDVKSLAGIDIRDILIKRPVLINVNYKTFTKIENLLKDYNVPVEAQRKTFEIYSLGFETIQRRFKEIQMTPEFNALINHPRILRLIYYKTKADVRLENLKSINQKFVSLNMLSTSHKEFDKSIDGSVRCQDYIQYIIIRLQRKYTYQEIKNKLKIHTYFLKIETANIKHTADQLSKIFTAEDLFLNCQILIYPWEKIEKYLNILMRPQDRSENNHKNFILNNINDDQIKKLTYAQVLSLTLYYIEKKHNFNDQGIWMQPFPSDEDHKEILKALENQL